MKNVGILTFHNAHNYGAVLQAYALKNCLTNMGVNAQIIDYRNKTIEKQYPLKLHMHINYRDFLHPFRFIKKIQSIPDLWYAQKDWEEQWKEFEDFINTKLCPKTIKIEKGQVLQSYDVLIVGSDQIWESSLTGKLDSMYFLDIPFQGLRVSYAASLFGGTVKEREKAFFFRTLKNFDAISTREKGLTENVNNLLGAQKAITTVDPTLLIDEKEYEKIIYEKALEKERFIFAYFVVEDSGLMQYACKLAEKNNCKLIELHYFRQKQYQSHNQVCNIGPDKFLWYVKNASYVVTNSFHGTVFSIIFKKNFYCVFSKKNPRIENLLEFLHLETRKVCNYEDIDMQDIDYAKVYHLLYKYRKTSLSFLESIIERNV